MKQVLKVFSVLFLVCFSFFYTDKVINVINNRDPIMEKIISVKDDYQVLPVNALIDNNTIIPGVNGREVDIEKSYNNMKLGKVFREEALIFKDLYPIDTLEDNRDKYIIKGSNVKNEVSLLYVFNSRYKEELMNVSDITVFVNIKDLTIENIKLLKDYEIYTYGDNGVYDRENLISGNSIINRLSNNKSKYCMVKEYDDDVINLCNDNDMYVVYPSVCFGYYDVKSNLSNGSIMLLNNLDDIDMIVRYIESKGYDIVTLSQLLSE